MTPEDTDLMRTIAVEMARSGTSRAQLARRCGLTEQTLGHRLRGRTQFTVGELRDVADALSVPVGTLLRESA